MAKSIKEQVEALAVVDTLKREENPLAGEWEIAPSAANAGKATTTGYVGINEKAFAGSKRKTALSTTNGALMMMEIPVLQAINQFLEFQIGVSGEAHRAGLAIKRTEAAKCEVQFFHAGGSLGATAGVSLAAADIFYMTWEPTTGKFTAWRKPSAGAVAEVANKTAEAPGGNLRPAIFWEPGAVAGVEARMANVGFAELEPLGPPVGSLSLLGVGR